jgi:hypothetical protein
VEYKEPEDESMSPCNLDVTFGDVDSSCGPRPPPTIAPATEVKGNSVGLLTPFQPTLLIFHSTGQYKTPKNGLCERTQREHQSKEQEEETITAESRR